MKTQKRKGNLTQVFFCKICMSLQFNDPPVDFEPIQMLMCLKINYPFFIENSTGRLVSRSLRFYIYMILNDVCFFFCNRYGLSIWRMNRLNLLQTLLVGASDFPLFLSFVCTANAINFNRILSWSCIHVWGMFYLFILFFVGSQMQNSHIQIFLWQTMGLVNHSICREKKFHSYENDGQQILPFLHKKDNIHSHTPTIWMLFFSLLCERSENSVQQRAELETKQFVWKV